MTAAAFVVTIHPVRGAAHKSEIRHGSRLLRVCATSWADYYANIEERRLRAESATVRPCLRCQSPFPSEGPHNRLCDPCRRVG